MKKFYIYLILSLILIFNVNAIIFENVPSECKTEYINITSFENEFLTNTSFFDITQLLVEDIYVSNFTKNKIFYVKDSEKDINLKIIFNSNPSPDGEYGIYFGYIVQKEINIYVKEIYDDFGIQGYTNFIKVVENVFKHELTHYLHLDVGIFENVSQTFNIVLNNEPEFGVYYVNNTQFFIDKYEEVDDFYPIDLINRWSVNFTRVFEIYNRIDYEDEIVARVNAICLFEVQNSIFAYYHILTPFYCNNDFIFNQSDADSFNFVIRTIMEQYYFDAYPEKRQEVLRIDEDICLEYKIAPVTLGFFNLIDIILGFITGIYLDIGLVFGFLSGIFLIYKGIMNYIEQNVRKRLKK